MLSFFTKIANSKHDLLFFQQRIKQIVNFQLTKPVFKIIAVFIIEARFSNLESVVFLIEVSG